jgi:solute carrier family 25 oxoglutarate transporter 11
MSKASDLPKSVVFTTAGLAGVGGWLIVHPFNVLAVRMNLASQSASAAAAPKSFVPFTQQIIKQEGVSALYNGLSAGVIRQVFYATSRFGLYETLRDFFAKYRETDIISRMGVGAMSGGMAAFISCPAEVSLVRMANDNSLPAAERRNYKNIFDAFLRIRSEEGVRTFWRGSAPFVNRAMLVGVCQVATYDQFRQLYASMGLPLTGFSNFFTASMSAGLFYSIVTMPLETSKNRMAFQKPDASGALKYRTTLQTIGSVAKTEGVIKLWSGFLPYYGRCGGHTVTMFIFVEFLRNFYRNNIRGDQKN